MSHEQIPLFDLPESPKPIPETTRITVPKHLEAQVLEFLAMLKSPAKGLIQTKPFTVTVAKATQTKRYLIPSVTVTEEEDAIVDQALAKLVAQMDRLKLDEGMRLYVLAGVAEQCGIEVEVKE